MVIANEFRKSFPSDEKFLCFSQEFDEGKVKNFRVFFMCSGMLTLTSANVQILTEGIKLQKIYLPIDR